MTEVVRDGIGEVTQEAPGYKYRRLAFRPENLLTFNAGGGEMRGGGNTSFHE